MTTFSSLGVKESWLEAVSVDAIKELAVSLGFFIYGINDTPVKDGTVYPKHGDSLCGRTPSSQIQSTGRLAKKNAPFPLQQQAPWGMADVTPKKMKWKRELPRNSQMTKTEKWFGHKGSEV